MNIMLDPAATAMPDVQGSPDSRQMPIQKVGIRQLRYPLLLAMADGHTRNTIAEWEMTVGLAATQKGTHMSRFIELLESRRNQPMNASGFCRMAEEMLQRLHADTGELVARFPYFMEKEAPVSGVTSLMDYQLGWLVSVQAGHSSRFHLSLQVPVTTLCPCSKAISGVGAHNQRSHVNVELLFATLPGPCTDELIRLIEAQASCELWGLLKRSDEKYVTEHAYHNPKFVEDLVRDVALVLKDLPDVLSYEVRAENFESIHNHSAYAVLRG